MFSILSNARKKRLSGEDGFTLIELLVVVVILGILIAIAIPLYLNYKKSANDKAAQSDLRNAISTLEVCNTDGAYPTAVDSSGTMTGCTTQTMKLSTNTTVRYVPTGTPVTSYVMYSTNSGGSKIYCYDSTAGGSIKQATGSAIATATC